MYSRAGWVVLLALASACLSLWCASATELPPDVLAAHDARIAAHLEHIERQRAQLEEEPSPEETHARWVRELGPCNTSPTTTQGSEEQQSNKPLQLRLHVLLLHVTGF
jgi:hypothetical protein